MKSVWVNNCRNVFARSTPTSKGTIDRCVEALSVGIRSIAPKTKAHDRRYLGYIGYLG